MADRQQRKAPSSFCGMLILALVALRLAGVIGWPWWEVLLPLWFGLAALFLAASYAVTALLIDWVAERRADHQAARADR